MQEFIIKSIVGGELYKAQAESLKGALAQAVASGANLHGADLFGADLRGADLFGANLHGTNGLIPERVTPLLMLLDQPGPSRLYKLVDANLCSPIAPGNGHDRIRYAVGAEYQVELPDRDPTVQCGAGINVATLDWCLKEHQPGWRVLIADFVAADIACIPTATDGKLRLRRCRIVGEKDITALLPTKEEAAS